MPKLYFCENKPHRSSGVSHSLTTQHRATRTLSTVAMNSHVFSYLRGGGCVGHPNRLRGLWLVLPQIESNSVGNTDISIDVIVY